MGGFLARFLRAVLEVFCGYFHPESFKKKEFFADIESECHIIYGLGFDRRYMWYMHKFIHCFNRYSAALLLSNERLFQGVSKYTRNMMQPRKE